MVARATLFSSPGGDTTQIEMTAKHLKSIGLEVVILLTNETIDYSGYDLVHFFNIIRPADILPHLKKLKCPFIISTVYVDYTEYEEKNRNGILNRTIVRIFNNNQLEYLKAIARLIKNGEKLKSVYYLLNGHKKSI